MERAEPQIGRLVAMSIVALLVCGLFTFAGAAGCKSYNRYQKRADAKNQIKVAEFQAKTVRAQIQATKARAEQRVAEAHGIREAQDLIAKTLTPLYVQHEAIQAQKDGGSGNRTYIPVGPQGVPLVADLNNDSVNKAGE